MSASIARRDAIALARETVALRPVTLDTETTGLDPAAEIVEICLLDHDGSPLVDSLVRPAARIPAEATALHGITNAMVTGASTWPELWPQVAAAMHGRTVAIYNRDYDVRLMRQSHRRWGLPWPDPPAIFFCIMETFAQFNGKWDRRHGHYRYLRLEEAGWQCGLSLPNAHRARPDAALAREVLLYLARQTP